MFILVICSVNLRAGIRFGGECKVLVGYGVSEVVQDQMWEFGDMRNSEGWWRAKRREPYMVATRARLTLSLHPGSHQSQWVAGHLTTGCGQRH